jgi:hypothetical protein
MGWDGMGGRVEDKKREKKGKGKGKGKRVGIGGGGRVGRGGVEWGRVG